MREMWRRYGVTDHGVPENGFEATCQTVTGLDLGSFFDRYIRTTEELDLAGALATVGVKLGVDEQVASPVSLGVKFATNSTTLSSVMRGSAAQQSGLAAGDVLIALDGLQATAEGWATLLAPYAPGDVARVHFFRDDELLEVKMQLDAPQERLWTLQIDDTADAAAAAQRASWLRTAG